MRIGLLSDTHIPEVAEALPLELSKALKGVDLILHAGDLYSLSVLDELENIAQVIAAKGDDDHPATLLDERVQVRHVLTLAGKTIWLAHELPHSLSYHGFWHSPVRNSSGNDRPDIFVFGHAHKATVDRHDGILCINPGSPTFLEYRYGLGTVGILEIDSEHARAEIVAL